MAENLPVNFPIPQSSALANYDWTDIASGLGYVDFYGFASTSTAGGTISYHASSNAVHSNPKGVSLPNTTYNFLASPFTSPRRIGGTALIYISRGVVTGASPSGGGLATTITVYHVRGAVETSIGSIVAKSISISWDTGEVMSPDVLLCTLANTHFKIGDYLKFSVAMVTTGNNLFTTAFAFDPSGADYVATGGAALTLTNTELKFSIPFRLNL